MAFYPMDKYPIRYFVHINHLRRPGGFFPWALPKEKTKKKTKTKKDL